MKINFKIIPYLIINIISFYLLPIVIKSTSTAMFIMLIGIPIICLVTSIAFGAKNSFNVIYCILVMLLFIPSIFIFYNDTAWVYALEYGIIALVGNIIGKLLYKSKR